MPTTAPRSGRVPKPGRLAIWVALGVVYVIWGSTYLGIAVAIETIPPFLMAAIRFAIAGLALLAWEVARNGRGLELPTRREMRDSAIVGALLLGVGNGFVAWGEQSVPSGIAAIFIGLMPVWFALLGWLYFRDRLPGAVIVGIVVGLGGVVLLVWPFGGGATAFNPAGIVALCLAPIGWAHGSLFSARAADLPRRPLMATGLQMLAGGVVLALEGLVTGEMGRFHPASISIASVLAVLYLIVLGSMVAFNAYAFLLRHAPLSLVGTYAYVNPVVAVALGSIVLHEPLTPRTLIASAVIVAAVAMIVTARGRLARLSEAADEPDTTTADHRGVSPAPIPPQARSG